MKIGFIGLGIMGSRMAANLQKHGRSLVVFNRTREKAEPLVAQGARWADSPAALALQVEVIITMLATTSKAEGKQQLSSTSTSTPISASPGPLSSVSSSHRSSVAVPRLSCR